MGGTSAAVGVLWLVGTGRGDRRWRAVASPLEQCDR